MPVMYVVSIIIWWHTRSYILSEPNPVLTPKIS
ncbi:unnamed protein product [Callosobruchus maculatus]|uniref:Uncharacterized protein n=1 Tax=Callosobruchus maculatus TaxID=64391 RepID=A0A653CVR1_CALMS|nr:unnamed protein product [Callosobruchus maculatus]